MGSQYLAAYQRVEAGQATLEQFDSHIQGIIRALLNTARQARSVGNLAAPAFEDNVLEQPVTSSRSSRSSRLRPSPDSEEEMQALKSVSVPRSEPRDPAPGLLYYPLETGVDITMSRLSYHEKIGEKFSRLAIAYVLDVAGNPTDATIRFDFVGSLASDKSGKPVYAAIAMSSHPELSHFPRQVAIKIMRKADVAERGHWEYTDYPTIVCEAQAMRKLSQKGMRFTAGALATFQDADYFYIVSVSNLCGARMFKTDIQGRDGTTARSATTYRTLLASSFCQRARTPRMLSAMSWTGIPSASMLESWLAHSSL